MAELKPKLEHISHTVTHDVVVKKSVDLSQLLASSQPSSGEGVSSDNIPLADLSAYVLFCPQGNNSADEGYCSIFVGLCDIKESQKDTRTLHILIESDKTDMISITKEIHQFANAEYGSCSFAQIDKVKEDLVVECTLTLHYNDTVIHNNTTSTIWQQYDKMMINSEKYGDVILSIVPPDDDISVPPHKKAKIDREQTNDDEGMERSVEELKVSSVILCSASSVFDNILNTDMMEKTERKITVHAHCIKDVKDMIYFMITNKLDNDCNPLHLIQLAHYYQMDRMYWECVNHLVLYVSVENFVKTINIFDRYEITKGYPALVDFAMGHNEEITKTDDFELLSHGFRCTVLEMGQRME